YVRGLSRGSKALAPSGTRCSAGLAGRTRSRPCRRRHRARHRASRGWRGRRFSRGGSCLGAFNESDQTLKLRNERVQSILDNVSYEFEVNSPVCMYDNVSKIVNRSPAKAGSSALDLFGDLVERFADNQQVVERRMERLRDACKNISL